MLAYILANKFIYLNFIKIKQFLSHKPFLVKSCYFINSLFMPAYRNENKGLCKIKKVENTIYIILVNQIGRKA